MGKKISQSHLRKIDNYFCFLYKVILHTTMSSNSPLDCLGLPDDITRRMQVFHTNPICQDKYFQYCKKQQLHNKMSMGICPYRLLDMYACHMAGTYRFSIKYSRYKGFGRDNLASRLEADGGEANWGAGEYAWYYLDKDAEYSAKFLPNSGETLWHKFITKFIWLNEFVRESRDCDRTKFLKSTGKSWPKEKVFTVNKNIKNKELFTLLDNNGIYFCKSWTKSKLINAWYKSP